MEKYISTFHRLVSQKNGTYELYLSNDNKIGEGSITV